MTRQRPFVIEFLTAIGLFAAPFILPHLGGYTSEYEDLIMPLIVENMRAFLAGRQGEMQNIVPRRAD